MEKGEEQEIKRDREMNFGKRITLVMLRRKLPAGWITRTVGGGIPGNEGHVRGIIL